jgi:hypothetical protein
MSIQELFVLANKELLRVFDQIKDDQWEIPLPKEISYKPSNLKQAVQYHTYDDAWVPDVLQAKTAAEVGESYEPLLDADSKDIQAKYREYNKRASEVVTQFQALHRVTHLSYGDFPAKDYLQHIITFRAFRSYDIAKLISIDTTMDPVFVASIMEELSPVIEGYRNMGVFPDALPVVDSASQQTKLLAMVGRA